MTATQPVTDGVSPDQLVLEILLTQEGRADPYPRYRKLRENASVHRSELAPMWVLSGYDDCRDVLRSPTMVQGMTEFPDDPEPEDAPPNPLFNRRRRERDAVQSQSLLFLNPPDHTRLRGLVSRGFTPRRVERLRPAVEAMTDDLLDDMADAGDVDALDALGFPLPVRVIGELVGVPEADRDMFRSTVRTAATSLEPGLTDEQLDAAAEASQEMQEYFKGLLAARRADPQDDLTSALLEVRDEEDRLTEGEMLATLILIFAAGFETTTNLIGNGLLTLLQHPEELERLRNDPSMMHTAVNEILRYQSPVQMDARRATVDTPVGGHTIPAGEMAITFLGSANRDASHFDEPERFRIVDRHTPVLSFGSGIHYCLGASLARLEGQVVFERLLSRFGTIELLETEPAWRNTLVLRGLDRLPVQVMA